MKKLLFTVVFIIAANALYSQIYKGQWMVGGEGSFRAKKIKDNPTVTEITLSPEVGYFFADKFAAGALLDVFTSSGGGYSATDLEAKIFARYYFLPATNKVNLFADAAYGFGSQSATGVDSKTISAMRVKAGPAIFLNPHTALEVALFYRMRGQTNVEDKNDIYGMSVAFQIHLGKSKSTTSSTSTTP